jgi:hypothetical protein
MKRCIKAIIPVVLIASAPLAPAQGVSDFIFTDEEGHLVLRYVGVTPTAMTPHQREEIVNSEFSSMVHDRLRADILFDDEPPDAAWAEKLEPMLEAHILGANAGLVAAEAECRAESCRLFIDHPATWTVPEHEVLVPVVQKVLQDFMDVHPASFEPVFLIAAHYQVPDPPFIKVYLKRLDRD